MNLKKLIDPQIMLSKSLQSQADKVGEKLLHFHVMSPFKYLLLWVYVKKCTLAKMNNDAAQRLVKLRFKSDDGKLLVKLIVEIRKHLQNKRNEFENNSGKINDYEKMLDYFYKCMINQLNQLEPIMENAIVSWTVQSLAVVLAGCLQRGWCGDGNMIAEYNRRITQLHPIAREKIEKLESKLTNLAEKDLLTYPS